MTALDPAAFLPPTLADPLTTDGRTERWWVEHLDAHEQLIGRLDGIESGTLEQNANSTLRTGGTLEGVNLTHVNFGVDRLRVWWEVEGHGAWQLGTYLTTSDVTGYRATPETVHTVTLIDKLSLLAETGPDGIFSLAAGTNRVQAMRAILDALGERHVIDEHTDTLTTMFVAEHGATWLQILNDLRPVTFWAMWTDSEGNFRSGVYTEPSARPVVWSFEEGETAIHMPEWEFDSRHSQIPNVSRIRNQPAEDADVLTSTVRNEDPASPTSIPSRGGREIMADPEEVDLDTQAALDAYNQTRLNTLSRLASLASVSHFLIPIWHNDAVRLVSHGRSLSATVRSFSFALEVGCIVGAVWEVYQDA